MFHFILGLPWLVVLVRFLLPLPWLLPAKILVAGLLLVASQHLLINRISSGSVFAPEYPRPLIILFTLLFGATVLLAVFQIALDLVSLVVALANGRFPLIPIELRYAMAIAAFGLAAFGVSQAVRVPPVKNIELAIAGLPAEFDGYRLLQLTDLHISRLFPGSWAEEVVARSNLLGVDLIAITGDFIDGSVDNRRADIAPLAKLQARDGVYGIPGNHEYFFGYDEWMKHDESLGVRMLTNRHVVIRRGEAEMVLAGVTDQAAAGSRYPAPDLGAALTGAPAGAPIILLDHQPRMAPRAAEAGIAVQLSGHTHGGMIRGLDLLVARGNNGYVSGLYRVGGMQLYVNNGTGLWPGFALRLGRPSELTVITLRRK
ncbi:metallophosphoesterase [Rhizobium deserti]|uniref:Metallophosphoesterase n=1 Tax=Rhizobium deserti TaxID=2547961 RepID=A0A4R5UJ31_9HYPH|nr:metallophosphoesterase [Rhizobium deserti]TDK36851.1 metallophosphoesterase [Rhizobium deserti]